MTAKRKNTVTHAGRKILIYRWCHPQTKAKAWRFVWRDTDGRRRYVTKPTLDAAEQEALAKLQALDAGQGEWIGIPAGRQRWLQEVHRLAGTDPEELRSILDFIRNRKKSGEVVAAVARFMAHRITAKGEESAHLRTTRLTLEGMARHFAGKMVADILAPELEEWWTQRGTGLSPKRRKDIRGALVTFWNWARKESIASPEPDTVADRLPVPEVGLAELRVLAPTELEAILLHVMPEWRAWVVLGAFAGIRPEELAPSSTKLSAKRGLRIEEIDFQFNVIHLPAQVSKGGKRARKVPLNDACRAGLAWAGIREGMAGPVCKRNPAEAKELADLGKIIFGGEWPQDALRHTYGSARNAQIRNLPKVAEEMGNSVTMLNKHYHNPRTDEQGAAWFAVRPPAIGLQSVDQMRIARRKLLKNSRSQ